MTVQSGTHYTVLYKMLQASLENRKVIAAKLFKQINLDRNVLYHNVMLMLTHAVDVDESMNTQHGSSSSNNFNASCICIYHKVHQIKVAILWPTLFGNEVVPCHNCFSHEPQ